MQTKREEFEKYLVKFELDIIMGRNFSFTKVGDGELLCISGAQGANCDGQVYSQELGKKLLEAYRWMAQRGYVYLGQQTDPRWRQDAIQSQVFQGLKPFLIDGDILLHRVDEMVDARRGFYASIKYSCRRKIFIGPRKLEGVKSLLCIDEMIEVPATNAFDEFSFIFDQTYAIIKEGDIIMFSAGLMSKVLMHSILLKKPNVICLDLGSAFDNLFIGQTRTEQVPQEEMKAYYKELL